MLKQQKVNNTNNKRKQYKKHVDMCLVCEHYNNIYVFT